MKKFFEAQLAISISISFPKQQLTFQSTIAWETVLNKIYLELIYIEIGGLISVSPNQNTHKRPPFFFLALDDY